MNPELWKQVDALLEEALDLPPEQRERFVEEACNGNEELRAEVISLVRAQSQASNFMERAAMKVAAQVRLGVVFYELLTNEQAFELFARRQEIDLRSDEQPVEYPGHRV